MIVSVLQQMPCFPVEGWEERPDFEKRRQLVEKTLDDCFRMLEQAAKEGADLAVTTESINMIHCYGDPRYPAEKLYEGLNGPLVERFSKAARTYRMHIVAGLILVLDGNAYNCAVLFNSCGEIVGVHKKVHLPAGEEVLIKPGDNYQVWETRLGKIGMLVCWDMQFPEAARILALSGADLIVCPTLGWENIYGLSRAYENSVYIAAAMGVSGTGPMDAFCDPSCIVDPMGKIVKAGKRDTTEVVTAQIDIQKEPEAQYGSQKYIESFSMRETRLRQRRPETYQLLTEPNSATPLFIQYKEGIRGDF